MKLSNALCGNDVF
jgi:hypothetical protein